MQIPLMSPVTSWNHFGCDNVKPIMQLSKKNRMTEPIVKKSGSQFRKSRASKAERESDVLKQMKSIKSFFKHPSNVVDIICNNNNDSHQPSGSRIDYLDDTNHEPSHSKNSEITANIDGDFGDAEIYIQDQEDRTICLGKGFIEDKKNDIMQ
ncbi:hypothetical protein Bhyg_05845 [Pseudolycoriella hygida]|uniref:Uncharacterized protein n=1 Tax=Pseudolycoriella hygida TaxID=35572 RepID=A0A9Q0MZH7_9DIPT|nr:hypothetical protein Bhyg_05845 [Pseudolycoriella hygida]